MRFYIVRPDGPYQLSEHISAFPPIPVKELVRFFPTVEKTDYPSAVKAVRAWVRSVLDQKP